MFDETHLISIPSKLIINVEDIFMFRKQKIRESSCIDKFGWHFHPKKLKSHLMYPLSSMQTLPQNRTYDIGVASMLACSTVRVTGTYYPMRFTEQLPPVFLAILNYSLSSHKVPACLKTPIIVLYPKKVKAYRTEWLLIWSSDTTNWLIQNLSFNLLLDLWFPGSNGRKQTDSNLTGHCNNAPTCL